jgi:methionine biosynthesis protein MetW
MRMYDDFNRRIFQLVDSRKSVLDVGCATGKLLQRLGDEKGCQTAGIEMDSVLAEQARPRCHQLVAGNIETLDLPFQPGQFDIIVFADVLEHLQNPGAVLKKLKVYLKDNGYVLVSIPNIAFISARVNLLLGRFNYAAYGIMDRGHVRFFTLRSAKELVSESGFQVVSVEGYNQVRDRYFLLRPLGRLWKTLFATDLIIKAVKA